MLDPFVEHLRKRIREEVTAISDVLNSGGAKSFDEYRHLTGILHGLALANREINDLMDALNKE